MTGKAEKLLTSPKVGKLADYMDDVLDGLCNKMGMHKTPWKLSPADAPISGIGDTKYFGQLYDNLLKKQSLNESRNGVKINRAADLADDVGDAGRAAAFEELVKTNISTEMEKKILEGQRKIKPKNEVIGGHSPNIVNNGNPNFAVEIISTNADGTTNVKYVKGFPDGNISKIKNKNTLFPSTWSDESILNSIKIVGDTPPIGIRLRDGATLHRDIVNGVQVEVMKIGSDVTSGYPTGGGITGLLEGFRPVDP